MIPDVEEVALGREAIDRVDEERAKRREQWQQMSPEEREKARDKKNDKRGRQEQQNR